MAKIADVITGHVEFKDVEVGSLFQLKDDEKTFVFMKVVSDGYARLVCLNDGSIHNIGFTEEVIPVKSCTLTS